MKQTYPTFVWLMDLLVIVVLGICIIVDTVDIMKLKQACHGQCQHKDKRCEDMCFKNGYCPMENN